MAARGRLLGPRGLHWVVAVQLLSALLKINTTALDIQQYRSLRTTHELSIEMKSTVALTLRVFGL